MLRNHVMLRIGGGWETLADYLSRHDPCRAAEQHRRRHTHANEKETVSSNANSAPSEEKKNTKEKDENKQTEEEDKSMTEKDENTPGDDDKTTQQKTDDIHEATDAAKQQELNLNEANENISA